MGRRNPLPNSRQARRLAMSVMVGLLVIAAALVIRQSAPSQPLSGVGRASDGDSFRLGDSRVRLIGLDAPELDQTCPAPDGSDWACGHAARNALAGLLAEGSVTCRAKGSDRYGRFLARCTVANTDLGAEMVRQGMAVSAGDYWTEHLAARAQALGIWSAGFDLPASWRRQGSDEGLDAR